MVNFSIFNRATNNIRGVGVDRNVEGEASGEDRNVEGETSGEDRNMEGKL